MIKKRNMKNNFKRRISVFAEITINLISFLFMILVVIIIQDDDNEKQLL